MNLLARYLVVRPLENAPEAVTQEEEEVGVCVNFVLKGPVGDQVVEHRHEEDAEDVGRSREDRADPG